MYEEKGGRGERDKKGEGEKESKNPFFSILLCTGVSCTT